MLRPRTISLAAGLFALMAAAGCQHHQSACSCPCSCAAPAAEPATNQPTTVPAAPKPDPTQPAVRSATIGTPTLGD